MRLLVLGGTRFVGWAVAADAVGRGWEVTTFNRGISGADVAGVQALHGDRMRRDDVARLVKAGPWDAAVDMSGYVPREVLAVCERLEPVTGRYIFMSTVSVYRGCELANLDVLGPWRCEQGSAGTGQPACQ